jgi:cytoskeleton protein RodZ
MSQVARAKVISVNRQGSGVLRYLAILLILVLAGGGFWLLFDQYGGKFFPDSRRQSSPVVSGGRPGDSFGQTVPAASALPSVAVNSGPESAETEQGQEEPSGSAGITAQPASAEGPDSALLLSAPPAEVYPAGNPQEGNRVVVTASADCWVGASYDEDGKRDAILRPGQSMSISFKGRLKLTLGNAGGVKIAYNGKDFLFSAGPGEARVFYFPPSGRP